MRRLLNTNIVYKCIVLSMFLMVMGGTCHAQSKELKTPEVYKKEVSKALRILSNKQIIDRKKDTVDVNTLTNEALYRYPYNSIAHELRGRLFVFMASLKSDGHHKDEKKDAVPSLQNKRDLQEARFHLIKALDYDKGNISARHMMLNVETQLEEYSSALIYCNELLEVAPYDSTLWKKKIYLYHKLGNEIEADRLAKRYMSIYTNDEQFRRGEAERKEQHLKGHKSTGASQRERTLREMIDLNPKRPIYYYYLISLLSANGRFEEAAEVAAAGATMCKGVKADVEEGHSIDYRWFIEQHIKMLCDLNRPQEAENYLLNLRKEGYNNEELLTSIRVEMAKGARFSDLYEANVFIYENTKSSDALNRVINTAIQRGYYDDALAYIKKVKNPNWQMKLKEYTVYKRMGNTSKAIEILTPDFLKSLPKDKRHDPVCDLMQYRLNEAKDMMADGNYRNAIISLESLLNINTAGILLDPKGDDIQTYRESAWSRLYTCYMERKMHRDAAMALDSLYLNYRRGNENDYVLKRADIYIAQDSINKALSVLQQYIILNPNEKLALSAYEEIAVPHVKRLIDSKRMKEALQCNSLALTVCPDNMDLLTYGVNIAQTLNDTTLLRKTIDKGLDIDPDNRHFTIKKAQLQQSQKQYNEAMRTIIPLFDTYYGDSTLIGLYAENCYLQADTLLTLCKKEPEKATTYINEINALCQRADSVIHGNKLLLKARGRYYEAKSKLGDISKILCYRDSAYNCYRLCKSEFDSPAEHRRISNQLYNDSRHNELSFEYQHGISGEDAARTGTAYMSYKRISNKGDEYSFGVAYAGRSGVAGSEFTDYTRGGIGFQVSAGVVHNFSRSFTGEVQGAWASHYFPSVMAKLGATWHLPYEWDINVHGSFRMMEIYSGVYKPSTVGDGYEIDHWKEEKTALWQLGTSMAKMLGSQFRLSAGVDGFLMDNAFYANGNVKCQYYPLEGCKSHFFVSGGLGTAPDGLMLDHANSVNFKDMNGFMSMGGYILVTGNIGLGLSGTWNTIYVRTERPSMTITPVIMNGYKNYFYINANVVIKF